MKIDDLMMRPEIQVLLNMEYLSLPDVFIHSVRVAHITEKLLEKVTVNADHDEILVGALLHDIGKLFVPFNLNLSPKRFTNVEHSIMHSHTSAGFKIVENIFSPVVCDIVYMHHEKEDGTGYPLGLTMDEIPDYVKLVCVADIYEALTARRTYKKPFTHDVAIDKMHKDAIHMDYVQELDGIGEELLFEIDNDPVAGHLELSV